MRNLLFFLLGLAATLLFAFATLRAVPGAALAKRAAALPTSRYAAGYAAMPSTIVAAPPRTPADNTPAVDQSVSVAPSAAAETP